MPISQIDPTISSLLKYQYISVYFSLCFKVDLYKLPFKCLGSVRLKLFMLNKAEFI